MRHSSVQQWYDVCKELSIGRGIAIMGRFSKSQGKSGGKTKKCCLSQESLSDLPQQTLKRLLGDG